MYVIYLLFNIYFTIPKVITLIKYIVYLINGIYIIILDLHTKCIRYTCSYQSKLKPLPKVLKPPAIRKTYPREI